MDKVFPLNISGESTHPNTWSHKFILPWIPTTVHGRPSIGKPSITAASCNVGVISLTWRWNVWVSHLHLYHECTSLVYAMELIFVNPNRFFILKGLGILEDQYIHSTLIHQTRDWMDAYICSYTYKHYKTDQQTR